MEAMTDRHNDRLDAAVWKIAAVAAIGSFMSQIDATVVNVSLATLAADLHTSLGVIQWVTSGYLLALALMLPLNGWLVDRIGTKALYLWCFAGFTVTSGLCGLAWSAPSLIGFRLLQGVAGGLLSPMAQIIMARAAGARMAQLFGFVAMPVLLAPLLGPVIAGAILQFASWRWLFLINLPVGALALVLAAMFLPAGRGEARPHRLDFIGLVVLSPALVMFLYGSDHVSAGIGMLALAGSAVLFGLFYAHANRMRDAALIDLRLFRARAFSASVATLFVANGASYGGQMLIPIFLVRAYGRSPSEAGWLMAPLGLGMMCGFPFMGLVIRRFGARRVAASGALLSLAGTLPFLYMATHGLVIPLAAGALFVRGLGMSGIGIPSITSAYGSVAPRDLPMATTAVNIMQRLGGPALTTLLATFLAWRMAQAHVGAAYGSAFAASFALLCVLHGVLFVAALALPRLSNDTREQA
jgi:EmrB/QacA subfamily drug resistance transporter